MSELLVEVKHLSKRYSARTVLHDINFSMGSAESVAIMGPSGAGKSTLLSILGLLTPPSAGEYYLQGVEVASMSSDERAQYRNRALGFIFQFFLLLPTLTVLENVVLPLSYSKSSEEGANRALRLLTRLNVQDYADAKPSVLSGGQQQRVAIARALINRPSLILADEPTGSLDRDTGQAVLESLFELKERDEMSMIVVTHASEIAEQCDRVLFLREGVLSER